MPYSAGTPVLGTREEILQSIYDDVHAIVAGGTYSQTVGVHIRQFEGFAKMVSPSVIIDTGSETIAKWLCADLVRKTFTVSVIGAVFSETAIATKVEQWMRDVERALVANPTRLLSGVPKAWLSQVKQAVTAYSGPQGRFLIALETTFFDTR